MQLTQLLSTNIPQLSMQDTVGKALSLMEDFEISQLCITQKENFIGIISKDDLLLLPTTALLTTVQEYCVHYTVLESEHVSKAIYTITEHNLCILPVLSKDRTYIGVLTTTQLLHHMSRYIDAATPGGIIILEMERRNYSFSEISRLVETHDVLITQLNTTTDQATGLMQVTLKLNKTEIADIIATFQRFEFTVLQYYGDEAYTNELQDNYSHLMHYLNL